LRWTEPVDILSRICTEISLNSKRKHTIYQLSNPEPVHHDLTFEQFGFDLKVVSYEEFRDAARQQGDASPLANYWSLLDYFEPYWFADNDFHEQPISIKAIEEDCPFQIVWPGLITQTAKSSQRGKLACRCS
jgi:hypothetical protein